MREKDIIIPYMPDDFATAVSVPDGQIDLARAALLLARDAYPDLDVAKNLAQLDDWANLIRVAVKARQSDPPFEAINDLLFDRLDFCGNDTDYYDPRNSYLNMVIERRTGLPITLSVVYLEIGWRLGLPLHGVGLPGHFIVRCDLPARAWFIDPFHRGDVLSEADCARLVGRTTGEPFERSSLQAVPRRQIIMRILNNLRAVYIQNDRLAEAQPVLERLIDLMPTEPSFVRDLGLIHFRLGTYRRAIDLLESYFALHPGAKDLEDIRHVVEAARTEMTRWN